jgi:hypothetical protein
LPKVLVHRRSSDDLQWKETREKLKKRDPSCRFLRCLTLRESKLLREGGGRLDSCHMFAASAYPELIYDMSNIYRMGHLYHSRIDSYCSPLTGDPIERNEWAWWWVRIATSSGGKYDPETDYESKMRQIVGLVY